LPDLVVYPENVEQISKTLRLCNSNKIPVIPFGAGSGFEGGINAVQVIMICLTLNLIIKGNKQNELYRVV
jgi:FAD/FMN-containing dehydrogenase